MKRFIYLYIVFVVLAGCQNDKPKPETKLIVQPINVSNLDQEIPVLAFPTSNNDPFYVNHHVKGKNIFIECLVQGITFRDSNEPNKGSIILYVDGKKKEKISSAAFIVKGLSAGTHRIKLEVVKDNHTTPIMIKEFYVTIP
ncbi:hypothetical protein RRV45_08740 [Bacillus sp. DTU_2020_1000418_1_SI_GHA_SEK_038]|uniref:hypothetical protein n=1 Tax=Bacillus sp. DTU_2020_1000418_1_SI_GHA_SEK_038 TaxID=3077585 RepID=UPI0028E9B68E|nr:hypothetical protein [Bacillus sp. DTU_2020_1000418_1_SI_GHA_SEK_038]WNS77055.1 hypothetical protein RRV45_08740 [Bacillus sp. DTU_2020_1000418_1_SI_GHA_SEK_038]